MSKTQPREDWMLVFYLLRLILVSGLSATTLIAETQIPSARNHFFSNRTWYAVGEIPATVSIKRNDGSTVETSGKLFLEDGLLRPVPRLLNATKMGMGTLAASALMATLAYGMHSVSHPWTISPIGDTLTIGMMYTGAISLTAASIGRLIPETYRDYQNLSRLYFIPENGDSTKPISLEFSKKNGDELSLETLVRSSNMRLRSIRNGDINQIPVSLKGVRIEASDTGIISIVQAKIEPLEGSQVGREQYVSLGGLSSVPNGRWPCWNALRGIAK